MRSWLSFGLFRKRVTTGFPAKPAVDFPVWSTTPVKVGDAEVTCPADAISDGKVSMQRCISCGYCNPGYEPDSNVSISEVQRKEEKFRKSFHLYLFDAGSCGACNLEVKALSNSFYDMSRLGISFAANPKHADGLLIVGVLSDGMEAPLKTAVSSLPEPKLVFAVGTCAISGGILGRSVRDAVEADVLVPGCPPNPYTILDALQKARGAIP